MIAFRSRWNAPPSQKKSKFCAFFIRDMWDIPRMFVGFIFVEELRHDFFRFDIFFFVSSDAGLFGSNWNVVVGFFFLSAGLKKKF